MLHKETNVFQRPRTITNSRTKDLIHVRIPTFSQDQAQEQVQQLEINF